MRRRALVVLACVTLGLSGMWPAIAQELPPDGKPDIHGTWSGKAQAIEFHLGGTEANGGAESYPITLDIAQTGADVTLGVTIMRDEGPLTYQLTGKVGRGKFWAQGTDAAGTGNSLVAIGGVNAKGNVMKGTQLLLFDTPIQVKFKAKQRSTPPTGGTVNACDPAAASDLRGRSQVTVHFGGALGTRYEPACFQVSPGTQVTFMGEFDQHPLVGGAVTGGGKMPDPSSPFDGPTSTGASKMFILSVAGTFPFYCDIHALIGMKGAVFVSS